MKKNLLLFLSIGLFSICSAQQFSFKMTFVDAVGHTDSLWVGYDAAATDTLDAIFNETNILGTPYHSDLDVRSGNEWFLQNYATIPLGFLPFETKKQIVRNICQAGIKTPIPIVEVNIISTHFPIKAYWNRIPFNDTCRNGSVFTSVHPGGWWDTGGFREELVAKDSAVFFQNQYHYLNGTDTVNVYWLAFSDSTLLYLGLNNLKSESSNMRIYPNPSAESISIEASGTYGDIEQVSFYTTDGQLALVTDFAAQIDVRSLPKGLYFVRTTNKRGGLTTTKFLRI